AEGVGSRAGGRVVGKAPAMEAKRGRRVMSGLQENCQGMISSSWARTASFKKRARVVSPMHSMASCRSFPERFLQGRTFVGHEDREQAGRLGIAGIARHEVRRAWRLVPG